MMRCLVLVANRWGRSPAHVMLAPTAQSPASVLASVVTVRGWKGLVSPWEPEEEGRRRLIGMPAVCSRKINLQKNQTSMESDCLMNIFSLEHMPSMTMYQVAQIRRWAASYVVVTSASTALTTASAQTSAASAGVPTTTIEIKGGDFKKAGCTSHRNCMLMYQILSIMDNHKNIVRIVKLLKSEL